jgi:putative ABC transport system permease protein
MDFLRSDVRLALRALLRNRSFALAAVLTLALGIGATTAIFSVVHGVLFRPLPYTQPDRLMVLWNDNTREGIERDITSYPNFLDWRERGDRFEAMAAYSRGTMSVTDGGEPEQVPATFVTVDFLRTMGIAPLQGRGFTRDEMQPGQQVVLLGHGIWQRRFGGSAVVDRSILLNGTSYTIVGVLPPGFAYPAEVELWLPLAETEDRLNSRGSLSLSVIGRLRPGVTHAAAQQQMDAVASQLAEAYPGPNTGAGIFVEPLHATIVGDLRSPLLVLLGAVALVLLIGCANVANLLLARGATRRKEFAIRAALGARGWRVARQMLTESLALALAGGTLGVLFALWAVTALLRIAPSELPRTEAITVDPTVLAFAVLVSIATGLLFGLAPLLQARRLELMHTLREGGRDTTASESLGRLRPTLISAEVGLALVLLVGAGLLIRSLAAIHAVDPGFDPRNTLSFRVALPAARYPAGDPVRNFYGSLEERLGTLAGVEAAGGASTLFLSRLPNMAPINLEGAAPRTPDEQVESVPFDAVTAGFFDAMRILLVSGRGFTALDDTRGPAVVIVNEAFVRRYFPDGTALGRRFTYDDPTGENVRWLEIVGIVADVRRSGLAEPLRPEAYYPHTQFRARALTFVVRTAGDPLALMPAVRAAVRELDPLLPVSSMQTVAQSVAESLAARRFVMLLLSGFAALALVLASIGIYGVVAYLVTHRTREMGIRVALGAHRRDVLRLIIGQSLRHVAPGVLAGGLAALALSRLLRSELFGVAPGDPLTFAAVAAVLIAVSIVASLIPAIRAARTDPLVALRQE